MFPQVLHVQARVHDFAVRGEERQALAKPLANRRALTIGLEVFVYLLAFSGGTWLYLGVSLF